MLVWLVLLTVGVVAGALAYAAIALARRHRARGGHGPVHATAAAIQQELHRDAALRRLLRTRLRIGEVTAAVLLLALLALVAVGLLAFEVRSDSAIVRLDESVAEWAADEATTASTDFLRWFTDLGSTVAVVSISLLVVVVTARRTPWRRVLLFVAVTVGGAHLSTTMLKQIVERDRPDLGPLTPPSTFSYPSGHASAAAACFAVAALCLGRGRPRPVRTALAVGAAALAAMVAASRVLIGVHWLSDVVAGLALGAAWFALCAIAFGGRLLQLGTPVTMAARVEAIEHRPGADVTPTTRPAPGSRPTPRRASSR